ncbi:NUDIX domain-containing protein [Lentilactobacillus otakiensis]|uniref:NUDIX domain-containing protein n=1 Tax=Lentilactobacillus otakiensis TaxID=481720 RepID=UPI003D170DCF
MINGMNFISKIIQDIQTLESPDYPWISHEKLESLESLINDHQEGLRNRKSLIHLSASAFVINDHLGYFIRHPYLHTILLPAGHVEPNELPVNCAVREFHEETGYTADGSLGKLIDLNLIDIPANPLKDEMAHQHIDFRYALPLADTLPATPELPVFRLSGKDAPAEFQPYFYLDD